MAENRDFLTYFDGTVQFPVLAMPETVFGIHGKRQMQYVRLVWQKLYC
jgi:hypothetical protein